MESLYSIERTRYGWLFCAPTGQRGIPMDAMSECSKLFPKGAVLAPGIADHYATTRTTGYVVAAIATTADVKRWEAAIELTLVGLHPEFRWWHGMDKGRSSMSIFAVFCSKVPSFTVSEESNGAVPHDAADFGRCQRLLALFPEWRPQLKKVAERYPTTKWPQIISRWDELEAATPEQATKILSCI